MCFIARVIYDIQRFQQYRLQEGIVDRLTT